MDFRQIKYFIAVAEQLNFGRAALTLNISQPPLTRQIQQLEEEMGVHLFIRTPKGVELTQAGELFLQEALNIRSLLEQATERTQRAGQGRLGRIDVGIFGSGVLGTIPKLILQFRNAYPEVNVVLHTMTKGEQIEALRQRRITVGFNRLLEPLPDIETQLVRNERLLVAVNESHPLAREDAIPFRELKNHPMILFPSGMRPNFIDRVMDLCRREGFLPKVSQEVGDAVTGVALVASGFGICLVPESATTLRFPGVVYRPFKNAPQATVDLSCIYRRDDRSPLLMAFLEVVKSVRDEAEEDRQL
ncbi:LysR family transcriptional regulator [Pandoraea terrae]|uniref:LysR family transcriptional regulator n=2 Tax=Pandoraea terrae TaxID=1537710 RepID=A0A5E4U9P3_9BURK|nr:LysR substrate-binding domain-containing protein [Pandoraea terrae]VVD96481.1 LysR family transcriptional regulator [Pandoraea terrae]